MFMCSTTEPVPRISAPLSTATVPDTRSEPTTHSETAVSSTGTTHTTISFATGHTPHTSVDLPPTTEVASRGLIYSVAGVSPTSEHTTVITSASHATSRLPKLSIPTFTGDPLNWQLLWDCFDSAVNSNPTLSNVQKLSYLRAQLQGDVSRVVAGFLLTNTSYSQSIALLRDRFGQPYKIHS